MARNRLSSDARRRRLTRAALATPRPYDADEGPCLEAFETGEIVAVDFTLDDSAEVNLTTGLLVANFGCTIERADAILTATAVNDERTVVEIARRFIEQHRHAS